MADLISPLRVVDLALAWIVIETLLLQFRRKAQKAGMPSRWTLANAAAGLMLLLALRSTLAGWDQAWFLVFMTAAGLAHLIELVSRPR